MQQTGSHLKKKKKERERKLKIKSTKGEITQSKQSSNRGPTAPMFGPRKMVLRVGLDRFFWTFDGKYMASSEKGIDLPSGGRSSFVNRIISFLPVHGPPLTLMLREYGWHENNFH